MGRPDQVCAFLIPLDGLGQGARRPDYRQADADPSITGAVWPERLVGVDQIRVLGTTTRTVISNVAYEWLSQ